MIVKTFFVILILSVTLLSDVFGASYSNVYVESKVVPMGYYQYGTPYPLMANPKLSQISSLPAISGYIAPCVSPCVYPAQTVDTVTPVNPNPNVLTYNAPVPNVPIVASPTKEEATGYEYSYVVYDENTGDHKAQRELSDGSVVRGEYSFLQPDGYVREVQYVADDISGFNAVVKNYLPVVAEGKKKVEANENKESSPPCHEIKNESLKEGSKEDSVEISIVDLMKIHEKLPNKHSIDELAEQSKVHSSGKSKQSEEDITREAKKELKKESREESEEKSKSKQQNESMKISNESFGEETDVSPLKESGSELKIKYLEKSAQESKASEKECEESKEELKEKSQKKSSKETEESREKNEKKSTKETKQMSDEDSKQETEEKVNLGKHKEANELLKPNEESLAPYSDILRCIEAAMRRNYGVPVAMRQEPSPLTYIVLNKPC